MPLEANPFDRYAVQHAVALRESAGGEVLALAMGPSQAELALREALALGADRAILLSDRVFAVADSLGTSRTLALALRKEGFDLILCGRKSTDSETWQVPPEVAAFLDLPQLTNAIAIEPGSGSRARRTRPRRCGASDAVAGLCRRAADRAAVRRRRRDDADVERARHRRRGVRVRPSLRADGLADARARGSRRDAAAGAAPGRLGRTGACPIEALLAERAPEPPSWEKPPHAAEQPAGFFDCWTLSSSRRPGDPHLARAARPRALPVGQAGRLSVALVLGEGATASARTERNSCTASGTKGKTGAR